MLNGKRYYTSQHYYIVEMARAFEDVEAEYEILHVQSPREADRIAESIRNFDDGKWMDKAIPSMLEATREKFKRCFGPRRFLLDTGSATLVYATEYDSLW